MDVVEVRRVGVHERRVSAAAQGVGKDAGGQGEAVVLVLVPGSELRVGLGARRSEVLLDVEPGLQVMAFAEDQPCVRGEVEGGQCTGCGQLSLGDVEFVIDDGAPEVDVPFSADALCRSAGCNEQGARVIGPGAALELVEVFLNTPFEGGRHQRRVDQITEIENL